MSATSSSSRRPAASTHAIAFESANDYIRNAVFRKNTTLKQLEDSAELDQASTASASAR